MNEPLQVNIPLHELLEREASRVCRADFALRDPVQFPRRFSKLQDIEIASLLCATIAWGRREMICRNCERLLDIMHGEPYNYIMSGEAETLPDGLNLHRTFFARNFKRMARMLRSIYSRHSSLNDFAAHHRVGSSEQPAWELARLMLGELIATGNGEADSRCLPTNLDATALKRINMMLRWLVRDDGIVDLGVWNAIKPHQLFIPLDVHVGNTARALKLVTRKANDKRTVLELTATLAKMRPHDPVFYDFALFGLGIEADN